MKKLIFLSLSVLIIIACEEDLVVDTQKTNPNDTLSVDSTDGGNELYDDDIFGAIERFRDRLEELGMISSGEGARINNTNEMHDRDALVPSNLNVGYDEEWLVMFEIVLNFSEEFAKATSIRGEEVLFYDVLDDPSIWGWGIHNDTKVILQYLNEELLLRVLDDDWVQTFIFTFKDDNILPTRMLDGEERIRVFRLIEYNDSWPELYIEDFVEKTGLNLWHSNGEYYMSSTILSDDGGYYSIRVQEDGSRFFSIANYVIDGVPLYIFEKNGSYEVTYDFNYVEGFDSFNDNAQIFLNGEEVSVSLEMNVRPAYHGADTYVLTGTKTLSESSDRLAVEAINVKTDITYTDIQSNINYFLNNTDIEGITYDYSQPVDDVIADLAELLYWEY